MAVTAPPARRAPPPPLPLLVLVLGAAGSSHFLDKTQLTKKGEAHLKQEGIIRMYNSVALSEPMKITSLPDVPQTPHQILGKEGSTGFILKCLTEKLLKERINDPEYQWVGPMGLITKESQRLVLTEDCLEIYNIHASDSGSYTCKVTYVHNDKHMVTEVHFMIYVYHKPGKSLHLASEFKTGSCETSAVVSFEKKLLEDLKKLIHDLQCGIQQWNVQCHAATDTTAMLTRKLTFHFVVTCPPGRFSADYNTVCTLCAPGSYNEKYGQTACESCPKQHTSDRRGSKTASDCQRTLPIWIVFLIIPTGVILVLLISWVIIQPCCRRRLAAQYIEAESELKTKLKTFANIATVAEIRAQRRKLRSPAKYDRKHLRKNKCGCLQEESRGLLSNVTLTETSTPFGSDHSHNCTWPNEAETSFEEDRSENRWGEE
ncbi:zona pellucida-binding protein 1-like isoform X8 [Struthio camelus]|uniref:zona pellucida-binding protein 1-like isoform X8 n=1 Tax=Struthio camelus TaxID=8801 RepID=UPI003603C0C2